MATLKLLMDDALETEFSLFAIHCSLADYQIAFMLNKYLGLHLKRSHRDIDFTRNGHDALFPLFNFEDFKNYRKFYLAGNKCKNRHLGIGGSIGLFAEQPEESTETFCLVPELKKADYLLKIQTETQLPTNLLSQINTIPQVAIAYKINNDHLKSKKNLIFE